MKSNAGTYLLSIIDHKQYYHIDGTDIDLYIDKAAENNFRERNPQLGLVEAVCEEDNPFGLKVGDIVAVNHRTFFRAEVGPHRGFIYQDHVEWEGKLLFKVNPYFIFFKYNNRTPEVLPGYVICEAVEEVDELKYEQNEAKFFHVKSFAQVGTIKYGNGIYQPGKKVLVKKSAFYLITLDKVDYFKVRESEIVAFIDGDETIPTDGNEVVEYYQDELKHAIFDLSTVKKNNHVTAKRQDGTLIQVWRNNGVPYNGKWVIDADCYIFAWRHGMRESNLPLGKRIRI